MIDPEQFKSDIGLGPATRRTKVVVTVGLVLILLATSQLFTYCSVVL